MTERNIEVFKSNMNDAARRRNPHLFGDRLPPQTTAVSVLGPPRKEKRIRQSSQPRLNGLETAWKLKLLDRDPTLKIYEQALRFRTSCSSWYKPDLAAWVDGRLTCWETKGNRGKNIARGKLALKVAASLYPEIDWWLVWRNPDGSWSEQKVLP